MSTEPRATVTVQPPRFVRKGSTILPPVQVRVQFDAGDPRLKQLEMIFATATLRYANTTTVETDPNRNQAAASPAEVCNDSPVGDTLNFIFQNLQLPDGLHGDCFYRITIDILHTTAMETTDNGDPKLEKLTIAHTDTRPFTVV
ncbi:uncharacterized protein B0T15DRAFT_514699 [Chaetomium strumarium]|uniref:Uncharacterized protein n=1 Tax=Chaetomium strumarium TaxID=1170767 RepID=A0AAJ0GMH6_9PEZI|nr:hypothetical protein B0T15DRAFT_514699 [Chaetomium strumarium]